jgi:glucose dehydrogenase
VAGGTVYVADIDHTVYALDASTGHVRWTYTTGGQPNASPAVAGGTVYIGIEDRKVYALDAAATSAGPTPPEASAGPAAWQWRTAPSTPTATTTRCTALDASTGSVRWAYPTGSTASNTPAVAGGIVYVGSISGKVYALIAAGLSALQQRNRGKRCDHRRRSSLLCGLKKPLRDADDLPGRVHADDAGRSGRCRLPGRYGKLGGVGMVAAVLATVMVVS